MDLATTLQTLSTTLSESGEDLVEEEDQESEVEEETFSQGSMSSGDQPIMVDSVGSVLATRGSGDSEEWEALGDGYDRIE